MDTTKPISRPFLIFTCILASVAIWMGLILVLHVLYTTTGIVVYSLFDTAPTATVITILVLAFCCFSIIPKIKSAWAKIALQVVSFMEVLALAGPMGILAMKLIYTDSELDYAYNTCLVNCGSTSLAIFAVLACINYFIQSRYESIKALSVWNIGGAILIIFLTILTVL